MTTKDLLTLPLLTRENPAMPFLTRTEVAAIWTEVRRRKALAAGKTPPATPITERTVSSYLDKSKPADPATGRPAGRYAPNTDANARKPAAEPVPAPTYMHGGGPGDRPVWLPAPGETMDDLTVRIASWYANRPGHGVGGGRPRKDSSAPRKRR